MFTNLPYLAAFVPYNIVPISELYAWSNNQKIHILFHKIAELVKATNDYDKIFEELKGLLDDFDDEMKKQLTELLNAMYEDGSLQELVGKVLAQSISSKSGIIDLEHIGRVIRLNHNFQNKSTGEYDDTYDIEYFNYAQGNCVFDKNGTRYWAVAYVCNNGTHFRYSNKIMLVIYKFNFKNELVYVTHQSYAGIGHANGVGYCNGYIYISPNSEAIDDGNNHFHMILSRKLFRIKFNDDETLTLNPEVTKITDIPSIVGTGDTTTGNYVDGVCGYNDEVYFFDGLGDIYKFDWDSHTSTLMYDCPLGNNKVPGGLQIDDNFVYLSKLGSNQIMRYNKHLEVVDWTYQLPEKVNCRMYAIGEVEGFSVMSDGMLYCLGCYGLQRVGGCYTISRFFRQSLVNNAQQPSLVQGWSSGYTTYHQSFIVAGDYPTLTDSPKNITGLTDDSAFSSIPEAIEYINHNDWITGATIYVRQSQNTMPISIETNKNININGGNKDNPALIGPVYIHNCPYINITNVGIRNLLPKDFPVDFMKKNCFYIDGGNVTLLNPYMPVGIESNSITVQNGIYLSNVFCNLVLGGGVADVDPAYWVTNRTKVGVEDAKYLSHHQCSVNTHGLFSANGNIIN